MKQLPAVVKDDIRAEFFRTYKDEKFTSAEIFGDLRVREIELDVILRQSDEEFISNLNVVRDGGRSKYFNRFVGASARGIVLAPHNATVARYNMDGLNKIDKEPYVFEAIVTGTAKISDFSLEEKVVLKDGCRVMYLVNSPTNKLVNGSLGTFKVLGEAFYFVIGKKLIPLEQVAMTKKEYALNEYEDKIELMDVGSVVQYPVKLAYALTIHKSQGLSFDEVTVDLSRPCFSSGQLYVALSRVRSPEGLTIVIGDRVIKKKVPLDPELEALLELGRQYGYGESWAYEIWNEQREYDYES
jgi:ATP-dependent DNA helicase PIF1